MEWTMMLASPAFSSGCRAHCLGGWWASRCGWGRPLSQKQIAVWRWWSGGLWVCSLWCPPSCCFPWRCLSSWHWDCLRTGQHPCHPGPRRVYTLEQGPLRPRTRDHAGTTSFYLFTTALSQWDFSQGNSGCLPWVKPAATESRYPNYGECWVF